MVNEEVEVQDEGNHQELGNGNLSIKRDLLDLEAGDHNTVQVNFI